MRTAMLVASSATWGALIVLTGWRASLRVSVAPVLVLLVATTALVAFWAFS